MEQTIQGIGERTARGFGMTTHSGQPFFPLDPHPEEIRIEDIAHALSHQCRFNGHTNKFYSVAQHSCLVAVGLQANRELAFEGLLHDAAEAYIGDMISPMKALCPDFRDIDQKVDSAVRLRFGLPLMMSPEVRHQDLRALATEKRDLLNCGPDVDWGPLPDPWEKTIFTMPPTDAKAMFLEMFAVLTA